MSHIDEQVPGMGAPLEHSRAVATFEGAASFPLRHRLLRLAWAVTWALLASWTPPPLHRWRIFLVNLFGGKVDAGCFLYGSVRIWYPPYLTMARAATLGPGVDCYTMGRIEIGAYAVVSQRAHLCTGTHDIHSASFQIGARPIHIGADAWVAAEAFVGPGVTVGDGAVLGARGAAFRDLEPWTVYQGNPAKAVKSRQRFSRA
jgi:putative colanic acid biosynthesis acetyltransferase WcaF